MTDFEYPQFYSFPPFFTIQPVEATRKKQMKLWRELVLNYHTKNKLATMVVHECPLWENAALGRKLNKEGIAAVCDNLVESGHGEWIDPPKKTQCRILWRKPEELATDVYEWAVASGNIGGICTLYELHSGEDISNTSFEGIDEDLLRRALAILEEQGKAKVFQGETSDEDGVKFF